jgi:hypothetical protein
VAAAACLGCSTHAHVGTVPLHAQSLRGSGQLTEPWLAAHVQADYSCMATSSHSSRATLRASRQQHGQPVDPNLQRLADAYATVASKVDCDPGGLASPPHDPSAGADTGADAGAGEEQLLVAEDLQEGLQPDRAVSLTLCGARGSGQKRKRCVLAGCKQFRSLCGRSYPSSTTHS